MGLKHVSQSPVVSVILWTPLFRALHPVTISKGPSVRHGYGSEGN